MADPLTLATLGATALTKGIEFLYGQAGEILKAWRERDESADQTGRLTPLASDALQGELAPTALDWDAVSRLAGDISMLRENLATYAGHGESADVSDEDLLRTVDALRRSLEVALGQRITFIGEKREQSGTEISVKTEIDEVLGYAAGVRAKAIQPGMSISVERTIGTVGPGASDIGVDI